MSGESVIALAGRACKLVVFAQTLRGDNVRLGRTLNLLPSTSFRRSYTVDHDPRRRNPPGGYGDRRDRCMPHLPSIGCGANGLLNARPLRRNVYQRKSGLCPHRSAGVKVGWSRPPWMGSARGEVPLLTTRTCAPRVRHREHREHREHGGHGGHGGHRGRLDTTNWATSWTRPDSTPREQDLSIEQHAERTAHPSRDDAGTGVGASNPQVTR
jgi:hypothetical protein